MPQPLDIPPSGTSAAPREENNQHATTADARRADALAGVARTGGDRGGRWGVRRAPAPAAPRHDVASLTARDVAVLRSVVLLRVLTYEQLHRLAFAAADPSIARRRIRHLARAGWLATWEAPSRRGGHVRYAHPTAAAIRAILPTLTPDASWAALVASMVPRSERRPLELGAGAPKWLAHQREVNHLVTSILASPDRRVRWASSWDCPFPSRAGTFALPQPDYVLVEEVGGAPRLIFGEHDRGSEPIDRFTARKVALYGALAAFPEICEQRFGIASFRVHVSVTDPLRRAPIARLRALLDAAGSSERPEVFRVTLGGWLFASPAEAVWFGVDDPPRSTSVAWAQHAASLLQG
ncbi:MAG: replication-relaxation family protein [Acidobacteriota bacterium]